MRNDYRTLSKGRTINSLNNLEYSIAVFNFRSEDYRTLKLQNIIFKLFEKKTSNVNLLKNGRNQIKLGLYFICPFSFFFILYQKKVVYII